MNDVTIRDADDLIRHELDEAHLAIRRQDSTNAHSNPLRAAFAGHRHQSAIVIVALLHELGQYDRARADELAVLLHEAMESGQTRDWVDAWSRDYPYVEVLPGLPARRVAS